jgi:outer membrane lipoprotein SlyB
MPNAKRLAGFGLIMACMLFAAPASAADCDNCGKVTAIKTVKVKGKGSGGGAVAGGVVGGVVGHQFGSGSGRTAMTILGAAGGAYAGNEVEKNAKSKTVYKVSVKMEFGEMRHYTLNHKPGFSVGDRVRVNEGKPAFYSH